MRHRKDHRKFSRTSAHRMAMLRNLATSVLNSERVRTTDAKAKEARRCVERCITLAKRARLLDDPDEKVLAAKRLHIRRQALAFLRDKDVVSKLFDELATRYAERPGGYTRIVKIGPRKGDGAPICFFELISEEKEAAKKPKSKTAAKKAKKKEEKTKQSPKAAPSSRTAKGKPPSSDQNEEK